MNELKLIDESLITLDERNEISAEIDSVIAGCGNNRQEINRLAFAGIACLTEAEEKQSVLNNKTGLQRFIGSITGTNHKLEKAIGGNLVKAQYAAQQALIKLAEQNRMSFELIAAVNNKLNGQVMRIDSEIDGVKQDVNNIYRGLNRFLKMYQSQLVQTELRLEKLERKVNLLEWSQSIEYQMLDGIPYGELDDKAKTGCLIRDFYERSHGEWDLSDLLLLKSTLKDIGLSPNDEINYMDALVSVYDAGLMSSGLSINRIPKIEERTHNSLTSLAVFDRMERLETVERSKVEVYKKRHESEVKTYTSARNKLLKLHMKLSMAIDIDIPVSRFDFILELLFLLRELNQGDADELYRQGIIHEEGTGVERNISKAVKLYEEAGVLGNVQAMCKLGELYEAGEHIAQDYIKAKEWYEKAAMANDMFSMFAMYNLGELYSNENGTEQNYSEAKKWYEKAAKKGYQLAMYRLGELYEEGAGVEQNYSKAKEWYEKAAEKGVPMAMYSLGLLYYFGDGGRQSYSKAKEWFEKSADLGCDLAIEALRRLS